ncbi:MAG: carotenoid oxygenase family protein [Calothrix sp. MO_167.B42]|nr:carotenoid oxygenase family protein [Calothrix sp. MO_167.B42]
MHITAKKSSKKTWAKAIAQPGTEFPLTPLSIISGNIPEGLRGTLYRNGPGRLERGGTRMGHWFDGDGAILAVNFTDDGATAVYRYVQTAGYQEEAAAGKLIYGNYGMTARGPFWNKWLKSVKNAANTSVLALPDRLLALWEGAEPHALDLQSLETLGLDNLGGLNQGKKRQGSRVQGAGGKEEQALPLCLSGKAYSAHPKIDYQTGDIFNFGISPGKNPQLHLYRSDKTGKIQQTAAVPLKRLSLIHDFVLAGPYLVFFIPPLELDILPVILGFSCYGDSLKWKPQLGTQILVIDKETLSVVSRGETQPWFQWHFANGYVDEGGTLIVDMAQYEDFQTNQFLKEVATGVTQTPAKGRLSRVQLNPQTGKVTGMETIIDRNCDFPGVPPQNVGKNSPYTYLSISRQGTDISQEILNAIARFDHENGTLTESDLGENRYPSEPIYAQDALNHQQGWIPIIVYDGNTHSSEVWVFDGERLDEEPVCKLTLPEVIPHGFHGTWKPA